MFCGYEETGDTSEMLCSLMISLLQMNCVGWDDLFEKLEPEFKSKYGINNSAHPYLRTMSRMLEVHILQF